MKVKCYKNISNFCPSQWNGHLENGKTFYARYRHGFLTIELSMEKSENTEDAVCGEEIFCEQVGGEYEGCMTTEEFISKVKNVLHF